MHTKLRNILEIQRCVKCGQPLGFGNIKKKLEKMRQFCLNDYIPQKQYCLNCNAVNSVVKRLNRGGNIEFGELQALPKYMCFDPTGSNPLEKAYGIRFKALVDSYAL